MNTIVYYEIVGVVLAVHLFVALWTRFFPAAKVQNPAKSLTARCCYHSELAASSQELWDEAQRLYSKWGLRLFLPSLCCSALATTLFVVLLKPTELTLPVALVLLCCVAVPLIFLLWVRTFTEKELKLWADAHPPKPAPAPGDTEDK